MASISRQGARLIPVMVIPNVFIYSSIHLFIYSSRLFETSKGRVSFPFWFIAHITASAIAVGERAY